MAWNVFIICFYLDVGGLSKVRLSNVFLVSFRLQTVEFLGHRLVEKKTNDGAIAHTHPPFSIQVLMTAVPKQFSDNSFRSYRGNAYIVGRCGANVSMSVSDFKDQFQEDSFFF